MGYTAHVDTFARDNLPPREQWPEFLFELPELRVSGAHELRDDAARPRGRARLGRPPRRSPRRTGLRWTYADLLARANRIARVLVEDLGLVPGNRVLLRAPNSPMHAACWFAVLKAGGIAVGTMPLLRAKELTDIVTKARISHALCDHRLAAELDVARADCPTLTTVALFGTDAADDLDALAAAQAGDVRQRRHGGRRHGAHRVHLGHDGQAEGDDALPPRRDGGLRLLAALDAARVARRSLHGQPAARLHVRPGRPAALSAVDRRRRRC